MHDDEKRPTPMLAGKTAIVTGGSRGIGRAVALRLSREGADIAIAARNAVELDAVAKEIEAQGSVCTRHVADLRDADAAAALVAAVVKSHGGIDIVVNNAGGSPRGELADLSDAVWNDAFALKVFGAMRLTRAAWPHLVARKGSVINIIGVAGRTIPPGAIIAASQSGAYYSMTKAIAELGLREGVQVNAINPGPVRTGRLQAQLEAEGVRVDDSASLSDALAQMAQRLKVRRIGEPDDIASLIAFILSPPGGLFHGALIDFDGGAVKGL